MEGVWRRVAIGVLLAVTALATLAGRGHGPPQPIGAAVAEAPSGQTEVFLLEPNGTARRLDESVRALLAGHADGGARRVLVSLPLRDRTLRWQGATVATAQLSPDGTRIAVVHAGHLSLLDGHGNPIRTRAAALRPRPALAWSPDSHELAAARDGGSAPVGMYDRDGDRTSAADSTAPLYTPDWGTGAATIAVVARTSDGPAIAHDDGMQGYRDAAGMLALIGPALWRPMG